MSGAAELAAEIGRRLSADGRRIAVAESLTGGLLVQALAKVEGSGDWLTGAVIAYQSAVKRWVLGVEARMVVSPEAAEQMATGVRRLLGADIAVAVTGVGGPDPQDGRPPGEVWIGLDDGHAAHVMLLHAAGTPEQICEQTVVEALRNVVRTLGVTASSFDGHQDGVADFASVYRHGFVRTAACTLSTALGEPDRNAAAVLSIAAACAADGVAIAVFPELTLSGYSLEDIVLQDPLLDAVEEALGTVVDGSRDLLPLLVVGAPLRFRHRVYNTAAVVHRGHLLGVVPKSYLPTYREFYERRQLAPGDDLRTTIQVDRDLPAVPFGPDLLFCAEDVPGLVLHVEICEDMWVPIPPSAEAALAGATVLANLSGSPITVGRAEDRHLLCRSASSRCLAAYLYAAAGVGESSTDLAWDGQTMIYENGVLLAETPRFPTGPQRAVADIDLDLLRAERARMGTFDDNRRHHVRADAFRTIDFRVDPPRGGIGLRRAVERFPFVPSDDDRLAQDCYEAYNIQVAGLEQRLRAIGDPNVVIGVSGGLDSTHALIVAARAMDRLRRPRSDILAFTLPGFATGERTKGNAVRLAEALGVTFETIDIRETATLMLSNLGHPFSHGEPRYDVTFENVQAGLRTDYLFRAANQRGGIVLGTGDLSELALGWCTYGVGDQMAHYGVNSGIPKTLIQHLIRWVVSSELFDQHVSAVLTDVLATEITPELVPTGEDEEVQSSEASIGPFALQDFFLFHVLRRGVRPSKMAFLAWHAWRDPDTGEWPPGFPSDGRPVYTLDEIRHWLEVFVRRFFGFSQFKRSALPNGPKVTAGGSLSPRGDWRAPSDLSAQTWLDDIRRHIPAATELTPTTGGHAAGRARRGGG